MLNKLLQAIAVLKQTLLWVVAPLGFIVGGVLLLIKRKNAEISSLQVSLDTAKLSDTLKQEQEVKTDADTKEANYRELAAEYERESHNGGGDHAP